MVSVELEFRAKIKLISRSQNSARIGTVRGVFAKEGIPLG